MTILRAEPNTTGEGLLVEHVEKEIPKRLYDQLVKLWQGMDLVGVTDEQKRIVIEDIQYGTGSRVRWSILETFFEDIDDDDRSFLNFKEPRLCGIPLEQPNLHTGMDEDGNRDIDRFTTIRKFANSHFFDVKTVTREFLTLANLGLISARPELPIPKHEIDPWNDNMIEVYPEDHWHPYEENTLWYSMPGASLKVRNNCIIDSPPSYYK
jgi:hypothetical protein